MSRVQMLRAVVEQRLTEAVEEIFGLFETTMAEYEEEIDRQRRLLEDVKPEIQINNAEMHRGASAPLDQSRGSSGRAHGAGEESAQLDQSSGSSGQAHRDGEESAPLDQSRGSSGRAHGAGEESAPLDQEVTPRHPSIIKEGNGISLQITKYKPLQFGCSLCPKFRTTRKETIQRHLDNHTENAVHFQDTIICRCNRSCRDTGHYHCPSCAKTIMRKEDMVLHVTACRKRQDPVPCDSSSVVQPTSVPPSPLNSPSLPTSSLLQDSTASVLLDHPYTCNPSECLESTTITPSELPSSRVRSLKSVKCPLCSILLYKKNLAAHIQRKHERPKGITAASHLKSVCVDQTRGIYAVHEGAHGFSVPIHVQCKTSGKQHVTKCQLEDCRQYQLLAQRSGLTHSMCDHIHSLDYCSNTATEEPLKHDVFDEMLECKFFAESTVAACKKRKKEAEEACC